MPPDPFVLITRIFNAPRERVFAAWTDPVHLSRWFAPNGCTIEFKELDLREGGGFLSCIQPPQGKACWCRGIYKEIVPQERIVHTMAVADSQGRLVNAIEAGMDPDWPDETTVTITFESTADGKTKVTLHQTVSEALAKRTGAHPSWLQMFDRLAGLLE